MTLVLDAAALVAFERGQKPMWERLRVAIDQDDPPRTHPGVVAQVWRGGRRQARLAAALRSIEVLPIDEPMGRAAGELLGIAGMKDVVDALLVVIADDGDDIVSSDREDIRVLAMAADRHIEVIDPGD